MKKLTPYLLLLAVLATSCSIEKRHYRKGYYFDSWVTYNYSGDRLQCSQRSQQLIDQSDLVQEDSLIQKTLPILFEGDSITNDKYRQASNNNLVNIGFPLTGLSGDQNCDVLILKSGDEMEVKILEIGTDIIKYKKCGKDDGPIFTIEKRDALMVKYSDGTKTVFNSGSKNSDPIMDMASGKNGKSQLIALLLCLFFGPLGLHRFYLGYYEIGIIQILTFGGCGIWYLIDLILILTGDLKPRNGDYGSTL